MLRKVIQKRFCVNNNDAFHKKNYENRHQKKVLEFFEEGNQDLIKSNFQRLYNDKQYLQKNEIQTRILKVLYSSELLQRLDKFNFSQDMRKQLNLDSLNITVLLTSIEHEFTTVFEDRVFETVRNLEEIVTILTRDSKIF